MLEISKSVELGKISKGKYLKTHCKILLRNGFRKIFKSHSIYLAGYFPRELPSP